MIDYGNDIPITNNKQEMIYLGKELKLYHSKIYSDEVIRDINTEIKYHLQSAPSEKQEEILFRSIYDYWVYGNDIFEEFYLGFLKKKHEDKSTYLTHRLIEKYARYLNQRDFQMYCNNKYETYRLLKDYFRRDVVLLKKNECNKECLQFFETHDSFVVKPVDGSLGIGIFKYTIDRSDNIENIINNIFSEVESRKKESGKRFVSKYLPDVILEEIIEEDDQISAYHPASVNGIRITTILGYDNEYHIFYPWFRVGTGNEFVSNASKGGIVAGIDKDTGIVCTDGKEKCGKVFVEHPDTGIKFAGFHIPRWDEAVNLCFSAARLMPEELRYIGWDLVLTRKRGWCILEANSIGEPVWEIIYDKGTRHEFEDLIGYYVKEFWWK